MKKLLKLIIPFLVLFWTGSALADSISPATYETTLNPGESKTITKTVTVTEEVTSAKVDVFFLTDTTGSMGALINSVKTSASEILSSASGFGDVAFGVGEYKDFTDAYAYRLNTDITTNTAAVQAGINAYSASGGGDWHEANLFALNEVATGAAWRDDSTRILVWFGDAPGHDPSGGVTEAGAIDALNAENITVQAINTRNLDADGQATRITAATDGTYYASIDTASIVDEINAAITDVFEEYNTVTLSVEGADNVDVTFGPTSYTGDFDRSVERTFEFEVTFTGLTEGTDDIVVNAIVDGGIVAREFDTITVGAVPEPTTMLLFGFGLLGISGVSRRKK